MSRTIAIGDIHGCLVQLDALLHAIGPTPNDHVVLLGDYVDKGPDSAGVVDRILQLGRATKVSALMGNHEQMMLEARDSPRAFKEWRRNGGNAALESYGPRASLEDVPAAHWKFLEHLVPFLETDTHCFVHASAESGIPMADQSVYALRWQYCDNTGPLESGKTIVCGHTSQTSGRPLNRGFLICLDTCAFGGGPLTALDVGSGRVWMAGSDRVVNRAHIADFGD